MRLGRGGGRRTLQTPNTKGIAARAEKRLSAVADAYVAKVETALAVDGVPIVIWNRKNGRVTCACQNPDGALSGFIAEEALDAFDNPRGIKTRSGGKGKFTPVDEAFLNYNEDTTRTDTVKTNPRDKITKQDIADVHAAGFDYGKDSFNSPRDSGDDLRDALSAFDEADALLGDKIITCPICFGSGKVDSWTPFNATRVLLDLSGLTEVNIHGVDMLDNPVPTFLIPSNGYLEWTAHLPVAWLDIGRATLFNNQSPVPREAYRLTITLPNDTTHVFSKQLLRSLRNSALLTEGPCKFKLQPLEQNELIATHFDLIYFNSKPVKAQLPEIDIPYEDEYPDWNLTVGIEVSAKAKMKEGSYICDGKYQRVWKVDSYTAKRLANGQGFGYTANIRALHPFEKPFILMNTYTK